MVKAVEKSYLERKLVDGLKVLHEHFESFVRNRDFIPVVDGVGDLTQSQRDFYQNTRERTERARDIVRYLEGRFGLTEQENKYLDKEFARAFYMKFDDPEGLYRLVVGRKAPQKVQAFSHGIALSFMKNRWQYRNAMGHVVNRGVQFDQLSVPAEDTIERLRGDKITNISKISIMLPSLEVCLRNIKSGRWLESLAECKKLMEAIFGGMDYHYVAERHLRSIYRHEMRHIFDEIMGVADNWVGHSEAQTHLFEGDPVALGVDRDFSFFVKSLNDSKERLQRNIDLRHPDFIIEQYRRIVAKYEQKIEYVNEKLVPPWKENVRRIDKLPRKTKEILSYLFSTGSKEKVANRLSRVVQALED